MDYVSGIESRLGPRNQLIKLASLVDWSALRPYLKGLHKNEKNSQGGPMAYDVLKMFKAMVLGQWHNLSDARLEESLRVRLDFMRFTGFDFGEDLPDETTLCRFRNKLAKLGLDEVLFNRINGQLEQLGLRIRSAPGALVDATVIESAARPRRTITLAEDRHEEALEEEGLACRIEESADPDARWLKKGKRCYFGYKGFICVAEKTGFIQSLMVTPAHVSEVKQLPHLVENNPALVWYGDKGYASQSNRLWLKTQGRKSRIMFKAKPHQPLTVWQKRFNRGVAKRRFLVEQAFGTLKRRFQLWRASYFTQAKVKAQLYWKSLCFNCLKAIHQLNAS